MYQEALKAYPQDKKSTVQRKAYDLWNIVKEKENRISRLPFLKILWRIYEKDVCCQNQRLEDFGQL